MSTNPKEKTLEANVVRYARQLGVDSTKLNTLGQRSNPDRIFWVQGGKPLLIELKRRGEKPTALQEFRIKFLREAGYEVQVHDDAQTARGAIRQAITNANRRREELLSNVEKL